MLMCVCMCAYAHVLFSEVINIFCILRVRARTFVCVQIHARTHAHVNQKETTQKKRMERQGGGGLWRERDPRNHASYRRRAGFQRK